jgi:hypothetical protein
MVTMAKELDSRDAAFALTFGSRDAASREAGKPAFDFVPLKLNGGNASPKGKSKEKRGVLAKPPGKPGSFIQLGTGDLVVPAILAVSGLRESIVLAVAIAFGALVGLFVLFEFMERKRGYWPALPFIIGFATVAMGAYYLVP